MKLAFVTSHPIQYQVPVFRHLATRDDLDFVVLFAMLPDAATQGAGFGVEFEWDIPLLKGYCYEVLDNVAKFPSVTQFRGCDTPGVTEKLRELKIDAVVVNGWVVKTCLQTLRACKRLKIPCIVRGEANHLRPRAWWKKILQRQLVRRFDAWLPIGSANRDFYRSYGVPEDAMFDARYCIENSRFSNAAESLSKQREQLRLNWEIEPNATCFLYCGKFETKKHPVALVHALKDACHHADTDSPMHLLMVGDGDLRNECERIARDAQLPITFTGFLNQSEIIGAYVASDCLVLPSDHGETWGLVVNEAMACGRPAIVSDQVGCHQDLIKVAETGFVFPFGDWTELSRLLCEAASGEYDLVELGENAKRLIEDYSPLRAAEGIAAAAEWVGRQRHEVG